MSGHFLLGLVVGLFTGGLIGTIAMALVAVRSEPRSPRTRMPGLPTG